MENVTVNVILINATTFLGFPLWVLFSFFFICIILPIFIIYWIMQKDNNCVKKIIGFLKSYKFWVILIILGVTLPICIVTILNIVDVMNTDILGYYITLIGIIISVILVIEQLKYENRVKSQILLEKILNSIKEIVPDAKNNKSDKEFSLWVIKQMVANEHVIFYDLQIRLAYLHHIKKDDENLFITKKNNMNAQEEENKFFVTEKELINMKQNEIEYWLNIIYKKISKFQMNSNRKAVEELLNNINCEGIKQYPTLEKFNETLSEYLDYLISSKRVSSFLNFITDDTYKFYEEGYLYHLPNSQKLLSYLSELNNGKDNKSCNQETILNDIWEELNNIIKKENP